jgi:maltose O-acetyltransferase
MTFSQNVHLTPQGLKFVDKNGKQLSPEVAISKATNRVYNWWLDLKLYILHLVSDTCPFWAVRKIFFSLSGLDIKSGSTIHMGVRTFEPRGISIGHDTIIGFRSFLDGRAKLVIGDHVDIASEVMIYNSEHDINSVDFFAREEQVNIGDYCFIGPRAIILPGVTLGKGSVVAAGAVVTKDVPDFSIVGGIPAKVIGQRQNTNPKYRLGRARLFQ